MTGSVWAFWVGQSMLLLETHGGLAGFPTAARDLPAGNT